MPKIIQLGEAQAINKSSPGDFTCAIDGGVELGPGTEITLNQALIHKPGSSLSQESGTITIDEDQHFSITAFVGTQAINGSIMTPSHTQLDGLWPQVFDFRKYYVCQTNSSKTEAFIEGLFIPILVPAGSYKPSELAALITDQTRTPIDFKDVPAGTIRSPSILLAKDGSQGPTISYGSNYVFESDIFLAPIYPRPIAQVILDNLAPGKDVTLDYLDIDRGRLVRPAVIVSVDASNGKVTVSGVDFGGGSKVPYCYIKTTAGATHHKYVLRVNASDPSGEMAPTGGHPDLSREAFGSTTGITFTFDDVTGRFSMTAHSPYLNKGNPSAVIAINQVTGLPEWGGIGPRGFLAFSSQNAWGFSREDWPNSVFYKMGFSWESLNGSTDHTDSSGWISTTAYIDGSADVNQMADAVGTLPYAVQSVRTTGPVSDVISLAPGTGGTPLWLIRVSILPAGDEMRWVVPDGSSLSGILAAVTRTYASADYYSTEGGPVWTISKTQKPFKVGSIRVQILNGLTMKVDEGLGDGSTIILEIS